MLSSFFKIFYKMCVVVFSARKGNPIHLTLISVRRKTLPSMQYNSWILFYKIKKLKGKKTWSWIGEIFSQGSQSEVSAQVNAIEMKVESMLQPLQVTAVGGVILCSVFISWFSHTRQLGCCCGITWEPQFECWKFPVLNVDNPWHWKCALQKESKETFFFCSRKIPIFFCLARKIILKFFSSNIILVWENVFFS